MAKKTKFPADARGARKNGTSIAKKGWDTRRKNAKKAKRARR